MKKNVFVYSLILVLLFVVAAAIVVAPSCWEIGDSGSCDTETNCQWQSSEGGGGWCERAGCWDYWDSGGCDADPDCEWQTDGGGGWCQEKGCWELNTDSGCTTAGCYWQSSGWCEEEGCWTYYNDQTGCTNTSGCEWDSSGQYCMELGAWSYYDATNCTNEGYAWEGSGWCTEGGCWDYSSSSACTGDAQNYSNCAWDSQWNNCYMTGCWDITSEGACSTGGCEWNNYSMYCFESGCWDIFNSTGCDANNISNGGKCLWDNTDTYCYEQGPWEYYDNTTCENADFNWEGSGWCKDAGCWDYGGATNCTTNPLNLSNCAWDATYDYCYEQPVNCWNYSDSAGCGTQSGAGCIWSDQGGWCDDRGCWDYDFTDNNTCLAMPGCEWNDPWCQEVGCWNYADNGTCTANAAEGCQWKLPQAYEWCEEIGCWSFDNNMTACQNANTSLGINCEWENPWCFEQHGGCEDFDANQQGCWDTMWCVWDPVNSTCSDPSFTGPMQNPACWVFDYSQSACLNITGCTWDSGLEACDGNDMYGVQCANITDLSICNNIPMLSTCCAYESGACSAKPASTKCWDNMQPPPEGAEFCEDYLAISSETLCNQIMGSPWFMPCRYNNNTQQCEFKMDDVFHGGGTGFGDIGTKMNCEFTGGKWVVEQWYDDYTGTWFSEEWCEMGFGMGYETCDNQCWACEFQDSGSAWGSSSEAEIGCEGSALGFCEFHSDPYAYNGFGWCDMKAEMFFGGTSCTQDCWSCFDKNNCEASSVGCKWFTDPTSPTIQWCDLNTVNSCADDCWQCWDSTACTQTGLGGGGKCTWDSTNYYCKPANFNNEICFDGMDNDNNGMVDCADPFCMFDPFCGGNMISSCGQYQTQQPCLADSSGDCIWIEDSTSGASWCGMKGEDCWMYKADSAGCGTADGCNWKTSDKGFCDINDSKAQKCFTISQKANCQAITDCRWISEPWNPSGGFCDFKPFACFELSKSECGTGSYTYCGWTDDPFAPNGGWCDPKCFTPGYNPMDGNNASCLSDSNCDWIKGRCEPSMFMMTDCYQHDGNETGCLEQDACTWYVGEGGGICDVDKTMNCPQYQTSGGCAGESDCVWISDDWGNSWCENEFFQCFQYDETDLGTCEASGKCIWFAGEQLCDPLCFNESLDAGACGIIPGCMWGSGLCDPKMQGEMFHGMEGGMPVPLGMDAVDGELPAHVDIIGFGIKEMPDAYGFGTGVRDFTAAAACNGEKTMNGMGSGFESAKFYWFLDTDGVDDNNCDSADGAYSGFEFFIKYEAEWKDGGLTEIKVSNRCVNGSWAPTPLKISNWKKIMCIEAPGGMVAVDKANLKKFKTLFNVTQNMRIYSVVAGADGDAQNPADTVGPEYYTPGSVDFKFEDCMSIGVDLDGDGFTSENDPDCMDFKRFGFQPFEFDCGDLVDNNGDGLTDCEDPMCAETPLCGGGGFSFTADANDKTAPKVVFQRVDTFFDGAFISFDTNEPANGSLFFYYSSAGCSKLNTTIHDLGDPGWTYDDYKPFHGIMLDNYEFNPDKLGYDLASNTSYYYKYKACDPSDNCAVSGCMNFTTQTTVQQFVFNMDVPAGYPAPEFGDSVMTGAKMLNESTSKRQNITINCPTAGYKMTFVDASVKSAKTLNMSTVVCDAGNSLIGMNSQVWNDIVTSLSPKYILISWATGGDTAIIEHCDNSGNNCLDVTSYMDCTVTSSSVTCKIPNTLGFSAYKMTATTDDGDGGGGGGGGGGGFNVPPTASQSQVWDKMSKGASVDMSITKDELGLTKITISVQNAANNVEITVKKLDGHPASVTKTITGKVYKYLEIIKINLADEDIGSADLSFKVERSWLTENNADANGVVLVRFNNDNWEELPTFYTGTDADYAFYKARSSGFSYFAIVAKQVEEPEVVAPEPVIPTGAVVEEVVPEPVALEPEQPEEKPKFTLHSLLTGAHPLSLVAMVVLAVGALGIFTYSHYKNPKKKKL